MYNVHVMLIICLLFAGNIHTHTHTYTHIHTYRNTHIYIHTHTYIVLPLNCIKL